MCGVKVRRAPLPQDRTRYRGDRAAVRRPVPGRSTGTATAASSWSTPRRIHGNPYDGHTLRQVIEEIQALNRHEIERVQADKSYRGDEAHRPLRVFLSGQCRGVHGQIKRKLHRSPAIEATISQMKTDGHMERNFLKGRDGDQSNAVLTAVGYNLRLVLSWVRLLLRKILSALLAAFSPWPSGNSAC